MDKDVEKMVEKGIERLEKLIGEKVGEIEKGVIGKKSGESMVCCWKKDLYILRGLRGDLNKEELRRLVKRLGRLGESWREIEKSVYIEEEGYLSKEYKVVGGKFYKKM